MFHQGTQVPGGQIQRRQNQTPFSGAPYQDEKKWAQIETGSEHHETLFYCECDGTPEQIAQRHCGVSILGDNHKLSGHGPEETALGDPTWAWSHIS